MAVAPGTDAAAVARTPFVDATASPSEAESPPVPAHHRRVDIRIVYDDGGSFSSREARPIPSELIDREAAAWKDYAFVADCPALDADGRGAVVVPMNAAFRLSVEEGNGGVACVTEAIAATATRAEIVIPANAVRIALRREDGGAWAGMSVQSWGVEEYRRHSSRGVTDEAGAVTLRGVDRGVRIEIRFGDDDDARLMACVDIRGANRSAANLVFETTGPGRVDAALRMLPLIRGRATDGLGEPMPTARVKAKLRVLGHPHEVALTEKTPTADGRFVVPVSLDGSTIAVDAIVEEIALDLTKAFAAEPATYVAPGVSDRNCDFGDVVAPELDWARVRVIDGAGSPVDDVRFIASMGSHGTFRIDPHDRRRIGDGDFLLPTSNRTTAFEVVHATRTRSSSTLRTAITDSASRRPVETPEASRSFRRG